LTITNIHEFKQRKEREKRLNGDFRAIHRASQQSESDAQFDAEMQARLEAIAACLMRIQQQMLYLKMSHLVDIKPPK
jgi:hypothetical protein